MQSGVGVVSFTQSTHVAPALPHAPFAVPVAQVEPWQQPPLQGLKPAPQLVKHWCEVRLQAWPVGQSTSLLQPQAAFTQAVPCALPAQSVGDVQPQAPLTHFGPSGSPAQLTQAAPLVPHNVADEALETPSQKPPGLQQDPGHNAPTPSHWRGTH